MALFVLDENGKGSYSVDFLIESGPCHSFASVYFFVVVVYDRGSAVK